MSNSSDTTPRIRTAKSIDEEGELVPRIFWMHIIYDWDTRTKQAQHIDEPLPKVFGRWTRVYRCEVELPVPVEADDRTEIQSLQGHVAFIENEPVDENESFAYAVGRRLYLRGCYCTPGDAPYQSQWESSINETKEAKHSFTIQRPGKRVRVTIEEY